MVAIIRAKDVKIRGWRRRTWSFIFKLTVLATSNLLRLPGIPHISHWNLAYYHKSLGKPTSTCSTPTPPKPSSNEGNNVTAVSMPISSSPAATSLYLLPLRAFNPTFTNIVVTLRLRVNLCLHPSRALILALPRLEGPPPRDVNMAWTIIVIAAIYFTMSHVTIKISPAIIIEFSAIFSYYFFLSGLILGLNIYVYNRHISLTSIT